MNWFKTKTQLRKEVNELRVWLSDANDIHLRFKISANYQNGQLRAENAQLKRLNGQNKDQIKSLKEERARHDKAFDHYYTTLVNKNREIEDLKKKNEAWKRLVAMQQTSIDVLQMSIDKKPTLKVFDFHQTFMIKNKIYEENLPDNFKLKFHYLKRARIFQTKTPEEINDYNNESLKFAQELKSWYDNREHLLPHEQALKDLGKTIDNLPDNLRNKIRMFNVTKKVINAYEKEQVVRLKPKDVRQKLTVEFSEKIAQEIKAHFASKKRSKQ